MNGDPAAVMPNCPLFTPSRELFPYDIFASKYLIVLTAGLM
jgi:hypothetical protein